MNLFQTIKMLWTHRKEFEYCRKTGKVPMCSCKEYYRNGDCEHLDELREELKKHLFPTK